MAGEQSRLSVEEVARRGDEIYEQHVRPQVEAGNRGKVVAIDVHSGGYALGETAREAASQLRARYPDAEVWVVRIGHRGFHRIGRRSPEAGA